MLNKCTRSCAVLCLLLASLPLALLGQNYRATITGTVTDTDKAVVPGAVVTVRNVDTNQSKVEKANGSGIYTVEFLAPAQHYSVSVTAPGFKTTNLTPILLSTGQVATENVVLEIGAITDEITATDSAGPMLDLQKADRGTLIDNKTITEMPLNGRNVFGLALLSAGVTNQYGEGNAISIDDNYNSTAFSVNGGGSQQTNVTIDGMSANSFDFYANGVSNIPVVDAVQEFKLVTSPYDASYGHTGGGVLDLSLKAGTNKIHGSVWEFAKRGWMDANSYYNNYYDTPRGSHKEDQYGFELDGPVVIPKFYNGRNKTFFMFTYEHFHQVLPGSYAIDTIDPQWLKGDFSNMYDSYGDQIPIYDPDSYDPTNDYARTQFPNNQIPLGRLNPVALNILSNYYPAPNFPNNPGINQPWEMLWNDTIPSTDTNNTYIMRIDQTIGSKDHIFFDYQKNNELYYDVAGPGNSKGVGINGDYPYSQAGNSFGIDWVHTWSSNLSTNVHGNYSRYQRTTYTAPNQNFDFTQLGLPSGLGSLVKSLTGVATFPVVNLAGVNGSSFIGLNRSDYYSLPNNNYQLGPNASWIHGKHTVRFGIDLTDVQYADGYNGTNGLTLNFDGGATQMGWDNSGTPADNGGGVSGFSVASMLLGQLGTSYSAQVNAVLTPYYTWHYYAPWVQDDWKITPRLTLNLGFRWDFVTAPQERHDRFNYDFDPNAVNPISAEVGQTFHGGLTFAGVNGNGNSTWNLDKKDLQPRIGFAYKALSHTVLRGGYGTFYQSPVDLPETSGFSYTDSAITSLDGGRTVIANNLSNPFPTGILPAPGNSQGLKTNIGNTLTFIDRSHTIPYTREFTFGIEQQVTSNQSFELDYVGTQGRKLANANYNGYGINIQSLNDNLPLFKACDYTNGGDATLCTNRSPNPFYGSTDPAVSPAYAQETTLSDYQLAKPFPQFSTITKTLVNNGRTWYNSMQATYRAHNKVFDANAAYTWSKLMNAGGIIDSRYGTQLRNISGQNVANRFTLSTVTQIPVGRGQKWFGGANRLVDAAIGGWETGTIFTFDTGMPWNLPSNANVIGPLKGGGVAPARQPQSFNSGINVCAEQWARTDSSTGAGNWELTPNSVAAGCNLNQVVYQQRETYQQVTTQQYTDEIKTPGYYNIDINAAKNFSLTERVHLQLRLELFNLLNHPTYFEGYDNSIGDPNFGITAKNASGQSNTPRNGQIAAKITF